MGSLWETVLKAISCIVIYDFLWHGRERERNVRERCGYLTSRNLGFMRQLFHRWYCHVAHKLLDTLHVSLRRSNVLYYISYVLALYLGSLEHLRSSWPIGGGLLTFRGGDFPFLVWSDGMLECGHVETPSLVWIQLHSGHDVKVTTIGWKWWGCHTCLWFILTSWSNRMIVVITMRLGDSWQCLWFGKALRGGPTP